MPYLQIFKLCSMEPLGTPKSLSFNWSCSPFIDLVVWASNGFCSYLDPQQLESSYITLLLKKPQGLIMARRCYMVLLGLSLSSFFSSFTQRWPLCCCQNIPGVLLFQALCTRLGCFLYLVSFTQMSRWLTPTPPSAICANTAFSMRSTLTNHPHAVLCSSPTAGFLKFFSVCSMCYSHITLTAWFLSISSD